MKYYHAIAPTILGVSIALVQPQIAAALSSSEVAKVAKAITVLIDSKNGAGTGVIIKKEGDTYTVLTAQHVVATQAKYEIVTPDNQRYPLNYSTMRKLPGVDLALVQFTSNQTYTVAKIGNSDNSTEGTTAYVAGFPRATAAISNSIFNFIDGRITANASKPLKDGYALVYSNNTLPGMSGGPVLNENGELIGVHGRGDTAENYQVSDKNPDIIIKSGFNLGIPINTFLRLSSKTDVAVGVTVPKVPVNITPKADNFYIQAGDKYDKGDLRGAIADYTQAISLNPNYVNAYNDRGNARSELGDKKGAIADYNAAIKINPRYAKGFYNRGVAHAELGNNKQAIADYTEAIKIDPEYINAYNNRGISRGDLGDIKGAIADYTQAIKINPNYARAFYNRGVSRRQLDDKQGAIADYTEAVRIDPKYVNAYYNRGNARADLGDTKGAIADYTQAITIDPKYVNAYYNRGNILADLKDHQGAINDYTKAVNIDPKYVNAFYNRGISRRQLGDNQGAIADYTEAVRIDPKYVNAYYNRGNIRADLGDNEGAIADYSQTIQIDPKYANAYYNRGLSRRDLGDKRGAVADLQKAASLYLEKGQTQYYQDALALIKKLM
ncbi:tetratricopeptide repeat-containing serine protease family protein [Nostoc sp. TCL26-01]|uniref:tetratricopeptide repeat-containing S1 family peptidase n=1 Tax=Nostoc sp. TCL26-01 TaxID=2576904 RepID=UPI0015B83C8C|nr:tetratricopeptide repeat protein [Nostoc sp. TCL26-01]QLE56447.1 tetratricopeptide repeat protein [Nostoc sp. TCL26-01]